MQPNTDSVPPSPPRSLSPEYWPQTPESGVEEEEIIEVERVENVIVLEVFQPSNGIQGEDEVFEEIVID